MVGINHISVKLSSLQRTGVSDYSRSFMYPMKSAGPEGKELAATCVFL